jgi:hypothetical protein
LEITVSFWEYINENQTFLLESHWLFICSVYGLVMNSKSASVEEYVYPGGVFLTHLIFMKTKRTYLPPN